MKTLIGFIFAFITISAQGQSVQLSAQAEVSIITCGPWQGEVYSTFGHSAIRIFDPVYRIDYVYNYGVFDFDQPNFYLNYTRGLMPFELGVYSYPDFRDFYIYYNRAVTEQVLNLTTEQKQSVFNFLEWNALPENKTYRYDYFFNNCSTKIRDVFVDQLKDVIRFDSTFIHTAYTIRQLTDLYLKSQPWGDLGIDICLGLPMDKKASRFEYMFLPDYLEWSFDHVRIKRGEETIPIVKEKRLVNVPRPEVQSTSWFNPWVVFGTFLLLTIIICAIDLRRKKISKWLDVLLFGTTGLLGLLLLLLWIATDHHAASKNFNLLWALPTNLIVFGMFSSKRVAGVKKYFRYATILLAILLLGWFFLPQQLNVFLLPFVAALLCRSFTLSRLL